MKPSRRRSFRERADTIVSSVQRGNRTGLGWLGNHGPGRPLLTGVRFALAAAAVLTALLTALPLPARLLLATLAFSELISMDASRSRAIEAAELAGRVGELLGERVEAIEPPGPPALRARGLAPLAASLDRLEAHLNTLRAEHAHRSHEGAERLERLAATTQQLSAAGEEVTATIQQIAQEADARAAAVARAADASAMVSAAATEVVQSMGEATALNGAVRQLAEAQRAAMIENAHSVRSFTADVSDAAGKIDELASFSDRTAAFVEMIHTIARRTNILSLNAAIEAARTGEQGMSFGVVAEEVRALAVQAADATQEVERVIRGTTRSIAQLGTLLERCARTGDLVALGVAEAANSFEDVVGRTRDADDQVVMARAGIEEIERQVRINVQAIEELSVGVAQLAAATQEMSATSEEMAAGLNEMATGSEELFRLLELDTALVS